MLEIIFLGQDGDTACALADRTGVVRFFDERLSWRWRTVSHDDLQQKTSRLGVRTTRLRQMIHPALDAFRIFGIGGS